MQVSIEYDPRVNLADWMMLRLVRAVQADAIAVKGGYLLSKLLENPSSIQDNSMYDLLLEELRNAAEELRGIGIVDEVSVKTPGGTRGLQVDFYLGGRNVFGIDVSLHDITYGVARYGFLPDPVLGFSIERILADKVKVILSKQRFRRAKDLYDVYAILSQFDVSLENLQVCLDARDVTDDLWQNIPFGESILLAYEQAWDKLILHRVGGGEIDKPSLRRVLEKFYAFALPLKAKRQVSQWSFEEGRWKREPR